MDKYEEDIEKYFADSFTDVEKLAFETRLKDDPDLALAFEEHLTSRTLIREAGRIEMKATLESFEAEMHQKSTPIISMWTKRLLPVAAMFVIFFGVYQFLNSSKMNASEVFAAYFETYDAPTTLRDVTLDKPNWDKASQLYSEEKYSEASLIFAKAKTEVPNYLADYYIAMCNLNLKAPYYQRAVNALDKVLETDNDYNQQAKWYKALALLNSQRKNEAFQLFEEIVDINGYHAKEAQEILNTSWDD